MPRTVFENGGKLRFEWIARRDESGVAGCVRPRSRLDPGAGSAAPVDLAVGGEGEGVEPDEGGREHVVGQARLQGGAELVRQSTAAVAAGGGDEVGDEAAGRRGGLGADERDGIADAGAARAGRLRSRRARCGSRAA